MNGGTGNDKLYGDSGDDTFYGGDGHDHLGAFSFGRYYTEPGNDVLHGGGGDDGLYGGDGDDSLSGENGNDTLSGGDGDDRIGGGSGSDRMGGGTGQDTFIFDALADSAVGRSRDHIVGFDSIGADPGDKIDVSHIDADVDLPGQQAFTFLGTAPLTGAGQISVFETEGHTIIQLSVDSDPLAESEIEVEDGDARATSWTSDDFSGVSDALVG